jgi:hypothetical protein
MKALAIILCAAIIVTIAASSCNNAPECGNNANSSAGKIVKDSTLTDSVRPKERQN